MYVKVVFVIKSTSTQVKQVKKIMYIVQKKGVRTCGEHAHRDTVKLFSVLILLIK